MKKVKVEDAIGLPLLHDITEVSNSFKGARFKRGHIIQKEDIELLLNLGKKNIFVEDENAGEIHEEDAALRLSKISSIPNGHFTAVSEGKTSLIADEDGFFEIDRELLTAINSIGDITICTIPSHYPVKKDTPLASMRIVPLVCDKSEIEKAESLSKGKALFTLHPYKKLKVGIIITGSEVYNHRIEDKFEAVIRAKLSEYPHEIVGVEISDDDEAMQMAIAEKFLKKGANFLVFTGGMSVDPDDITYTSIRRLGGEIITHGVPAQPGNMTAVAYKGDIALLGVPGAAIKSPRTVLDVLLPSIFAGVKITRENLIRLGEGGLCMHCDNCHFPNCTFGRY